MKIQKEGGRVLNLPDRVANRLIAKGRFKAIEEVEKTPEPVKKKRTKKAK